MSSEEENIWKVNHLRLVSSSSLFRGWRGRRGVFPRPHGINLQWKHGTSFVHFGNWGVSLRIPSCQPQPSNGRTFTQVQALLFVIGCPVTLASFIFAGLYCLELSETSDSPPACCPLAPLPPVGPSLGLRWNERTGEIYVSNPDGTITVYHRK